MVLKAASEKVPGIRKPFLSSVIYICANSRQPLMAQCSEHRGPRRRLLAEAALRTAHSAAVPASGAPQPPLSISGTPPTSAGRQTGCDNS